MKSKFKVGDRVAVYDSRMLNGRQVGIVTMTRDPNGHHKIAMVVDKVRRYDKYGEIIVHPKQCRKIKVK